jgi:hypothetical protein
VMRGVVRGMHTAWREMFKESKHGVLWARFGMGAERQHTQAGNASDHCFTGMPTITAAACVEDKDKDKTKLAPKEFRTNEEEAKDPVKALLAAFNGY